MVHKLFFPGRHGLGDNIAAYFLVPHTRKVMEQTYHASLLGMLDGVKMIYEGFMNPSIPSVFEALSFPIQCVTTEQQPGVALAAPDNRFPELLPEGHINVLGPQFPGEIAELAGMPVPLPLEDLQPEMEVPEQFIIVCAESGRSAMIIDDQSLVELCRSFGFPVVLTGKAIPRNGNRLSTVMGDWDYRNKLTIRQTVTLASKAKAIVSTISWMRLCAQLVGTPVIEVLPLDSEAERNKVVFDYAHAYNLVATAGTLNVWTDLCNRVELARQLERMLTGRK
jgi:nicotinamidase-related amidase